MTKIKSATIIIRPVNFFIIILAVFIAGVIAGADLENLGGLALTSLALAFASATGNVFNDIVDLEVDKKNRPNRILVSGKLTIREAKVLLVVCCVSSISAAALVNAEVLVLNLFIIAAVFLYSIFFQYKILLGNVIVSLMTASALIAGGLAVNNLYASMIPAFFAFATNLIREIIKDMEDVEGDKSNDVITFPVKYGLSKTVRLINVLTGLLLMLTLTPYVFGIYSIYYLLIIILFVHGIFIYMLYSLQKNISKSNLGKMSNLVKLNMVIGLIAIYIGS